MSALDLSLARVRALYHALFIGEAEEGERTRALRDEDEKKTRELAAFLVEAARALPSSKRRALTIVDAACGKSALGLLLAALVVAPRGQRARFVLIDHEARFIARAAAAAAKLAARGLVDERITFSFEVGALGEHEHVPRDVDLVVALHACGRASDDVIDVAIAREARALLVVPCCYGAHPLAHDDDRGLPPGQAIARARASSLGVPAHGLVGRRIAAALIDVERTLRLEAAGYETACVELFSSTISPHHLLYRARRVMEPARMAEHADLAARLAHERSS